MPTETSAPTETTGTDGVACGKKEMAEKDNDEWHSARIQGILHAAEPGKKSLWSMTVETLRMADGGKSKKHDVYTESLQEGTDMLQELVNLQRTENNEKYSFDFTPLADFQVELSDLLRAFVQWSCKESPVSRHDRSRDNVNKTNNNNKTKKMYNISKAFRRLESYVDWMYDHRSILTQELTSSERQTAHAMWTIKLTRAKSSTEEETTLAWWIRLSEIDAKAVKAFPHDKTLHYTVWICHALLFAPHDHVVIWEDWQHVSLMQLLTMLPADLAAKLDRLAIGVLPIRIKQVYLLNSPGWVHVLLKLITPFLSKKMRRRITVVGHKESVQELLDRTVGAEAVPKGFCGLEGMVDRDMFDERLSCKE